MLIYTVAIYTHFYFFSVFSYRRRGRRPRPKRPPPFSRLWTPDAELQAEAEKWKVQVQVQVQVVRLETMSQLRLVSVSDRDYGGVHNQAPDTQEVVLREPPAD